MLRSPTIIIASSSFDAKSMISSRPKSSPGNRTTNVGGKKCRVLFSYQPAHEDELELKV